MEIKMAQQNLNYSQPLLYTYFIKKITYTINNQLFILLESKQKFSPIEVCELFKNLALPLDKIKQYQKDNKEYLEIYTIPLKQHINISILQDVINKAINHQIPIKCLLYKLITYEEFNYEKILFLQIIAHYIEQLLPEKKFESIIRIFLHNAELIKLIVELFFNKSHQTEILIQEKLKNITNYEEYKILHLVISIISSIQRTNFFTNKETKAFKFYLASIKHLLPDLEPNIEIFVYHKEFLGVHLRTSKISRGGIRWSNREDFRQEIKDLMITQEAKNAIIIPTGAKGGLFIEKNVTKEEFTHYYRLYIDAMLDLIDKKPSHDSDFYFVVAADKGTADMSDVANEIAIKKGYWLKDAFASGGTHGYSHKKLGVTAHGAWISAARHFIEKGIDIFHDPITIVGTGSMRGDVFGNGLLINPNCKLIGAISSHEIFIDPNPNAKIAYEERKRLFEKGAGWGEYDPTKISEGGGVFLRNQKEITLSPQIKKLLHIRKDRISAEELARKLLQAKVDMLYIGGIGTYVKSSEELNIHIADKFNEPVRVDASELQAFAVCEGGNLGLTQKARIEYAKNGGHINLDSIDNSAGVHTSDYEVNLKIALNSAVQSNKIDENKKHTILKNLTQEVLQKVFATNHTQPLAISLDQIRSALDLEEYIKVINVLEKQLEFFNKKDFHIPKTQDFENVLKKDGGIVRPVLGIVLSFSKIFLKHQILQSNLVDEPFFEHYLYKYFPKSLYPTFEKEVLAHPLKKEIIATTAANIIIDNAGIRFLADFEELHTEKFIIKIKSYLLLYTLLGIAKKKQELYANELNLKEKLIENLLAIEHAVEFSLKWILRNYQEINLEPFHILNYKSQINYFIDKTNNLSQYIDLIKFVMPAIYLKEIKEHSLQEVLELLLQIITMLGIDKLLQIIYQFAPKDITGKELKTQLIELVEYFVVTIAKDVILFNRSKESLQQSLQNYFEEKMIDQEAYNQKIDELSQTPQDLMKISNMVHKLLLETI